MRTVLDSGVVDTEKSRRRATAGVGRGLMGIAEMVAMYVAEQYRIDLAEPQIVSRAA